LFCDYPIGRFNYRKQQLEIQIDGDPRLECRIILLEQNEHEQYQCKLVNLGTGEQLQALKQEKGLTEFSSTGGQKLGLRWTKMKTANNE
jgi:hypothetical protein